MKPWHYSVRVLTFLILCCICGGCGKNSNGQGGNAYPQFVELLPGSFIMGDQSGSNTLPLHLINLSPYSISQREVTAAQYAEFLNDINHITNAPVYLKEVRSLPESKEQNVYLIEDKKANVSRVGARFVPDKGRGGNAVSWVTYYGAEAYCNWLSKKLNRKCSIPTEAEWENASKTKRYKLDGFDHEMWEWCSDWYGSYDSEEDTDPTGPIAPEDAKNPKKVIRGGTYESGHAKIGGFSMLDSPGNRETAGSRAAEIRLGYNFGGIGFRVVSDVATTAQLSLAGQATSNVQHSTSK